MKRAIHAKILVDSECYEKFLELTKEKGMKVMAYIGQLIEKEVYRTTNTEISGTPSPFNSPKESHSGSELDHRGEGVPFDSTLFRGEHTSL